MTSSRLQGGERITQTTQRNAPKDKINTPSPSHSVPSKPLNVQAQRMAKRSSSKTKVKAPSLIQEPDDAPLSYEVPTRQEPLYTGRVLCDVIAISALHHGAGSRGNTQILRTHDVIQPDGSKRKVAFISGNSIKQNWVRRPGVLFALDAMGIERASLPKRIVDLLFSGGRLTGGGSASSVKLSRARRLEEIFPILALTGYSSQRRITSSKIIVDNLELVCQDNAHLMSSEHAALPHAKLRQGHFRGEDFGTRMEATRNPAIAALLPHEERDALERAVDEGGDKDATQSSQMIFDFETILAGSRFYGGVHFSSLCDMEMACLESALSYATHGTTQDNRLIHLVGAKSATGYGKVGVHWKAMMRVSPKAMRYEPSSALVVQGREDASPKSTTRLGSYVDHLREHTDEVVAILEDMSK